MHFQVSNFSFFWIATKIENFLNYGSMNSNEIAIGCMDSMGLIAEGCVGIHPLHSQVRA